MGDEEHRRLRAGGGYRTLRSFRTTTIIYDATLSFCARFISQTSRTVDQMVQAARSGRQNIAEGCRASVASNQTELRLLNVARASLDELLLDYEDFLRQRNLRAWRKDDPEARSVREVAKTLKDRTDRTDLSDPSDQGDAAAYARWTDHPDPAVVANSIICLIHQANYLLDQQISSAERAFIEDGGYTEKLAAARMEYRRSAPEDGSPTCPACGNTMVLRTARKGVNAGQSFWGCSSYPQCKSTRKPE